jgi:hypothetical protein
MIKPKDYYSNPWRDHTRQDGIQSGRQNWSDLQDDDPEPLKVARGILQAMILGLAFWGVLGIVILLLLGVL